jgi:multiple sugar transport system substrate-binding protein
MELSTFGASYNVDLFREGGVEPPTDAWTWSDYFEAGRAFVRGGSDARTRWGISHSFTNWLMMGLFRGEGGTTFTADGRACAVDHERNAALLDLLRRQLDAGVVRPPDLGSRLDAFVNQEVAVYLDGSYATNAVRDRIQGRFLWDTAALPRGSTGERHVSVAGGCWVVAAGAGRSPAAWDLVSWLTRPGYDPVTAQNTGSLPLRRSLLDAWSRDSRPPGQPPAHIEIFRRQVEQDGAFWRYPKFWTEFDDVWKSSMSDWYRSGDARAALSTVRRVTNEAARRYR